MKSAASSSRTCETDCSPRAKLDIKTGLWTMRFRLRRNDR
jgi:hypothetical protein